ncbi:MAG: pyruvate formate lyase family protein [Clostridia bacterium]|nr:pyruvate formate lyase family protein [Clostridia bacterium]
MSEVKLKVEDKFIRSDRIKALQERSRQLAISGKRNLYKANNTQLVYHWSDAGNAIAPRSGEHEFEGLSLGDHGCRVDIGMDFPLLDKMPSKLEGYQKTAESWGKDFKFLLDNSPAEIYENELIVGEFHWEMNEVRPYDFGEEVKALGKKARALGAGGNSHGHTCPDLSIGLSQGWGGILERIEKSLKKYEELDNAKKVTYLKGAKYTCEAIIAYIKKYSEKAYELYEKESKGEQKERYLKISKACGNICSNPPRSFYEGVQWLTFAVITDRIVGHGNGYGRIDQYLIDLYKNDISTGKVTRDEAREYLAEMFLKLRGQFFSLGGRDKFGKDATNDVSFLVMEAYDMIDDYNNLGVMWHLDMNEEFYKYVCDVLARHGAGIPSLVNYDVIYRTELRSGVPEEDAAEVCYSGCQWYCIPGREYCDQDTNAIVLTDPMFRAIDTAIESSFDRFEDLYGEFVKELKRTCEALRIFKDAQYDVIDKVWPEIVTSLNCYGTIERGLDITAHRGVDYQFTSTNILGIPNVCDSFFAIKNLVFDRGVYTLKQVRDAVREDWNDNEIMRLQLLKEHKYGNDYDDVDAMYVRITESIADIMDNMTNNRGQQYRASLFQFQGHTASEIIGATPDGRYSYEPLAHGCNPTAGRNTRGLLATANSCAKADNKKFLGGSLQVELQPDFFDGKNDIYKYVEEFSKAFFMKNGVQINLNIMDLNELKNAIDDPNNEKYWNIIVKVTGYTARFVTLSKSFQKEFVGRTNYERI